MLGGTKITMEESPFNLEDLKLQRIPKGTTVICDCGAPCVTGVEILLAENEKLLCAQCSDGS